MEQADRYVLYCTKKKKKKGWKASGGCEEKGGRGERGGREVGRVRSEKTKRGFGRPVREIFFVLIVGGQSEAKKQVRKPAKRRAEGES